MTDEKGEDQIAELLRSTAERSIDFLRTLPDRRVHPLSTPDDLRPLFGGSLPDEGAPADEVVDRLTAVAARGVVASAGPRYFGFVIGGSLPAALAADWLTSAWDQNAVLYATSPAAAVAEDVAAEWLLDILDLPRESTVGFTTGCQMANFVGLAAGRRSVLLRRGWDVERQGLQGAPKIRVLVGDQSHVTIAVALQMLGFGTQTLERVPVDEQGRMRPDALEQVLASGDETAPTLVCAQVGNVNSGASDDVGAIARIVYKQESAWLHVDGAFGLWARAVPELRPQVAGLEEADPGRAICTNGSTSPTTRAWSSSATRPHINSRCSCRLPTWFRPSQVSATARASCPSHRDARAASRSTLLLPAWAAQALRILSADAARSPLAWRLPWRSSRGSRS